MKIVIIGTGNVAWHLVNAIASSEHEVVQLCNFHSKKIDVLFDPFQLETCTDTSKINRSADIYILAIKDSELANLPLDKLANHQVIVHTSGMMSIDLLERYAENSACLYPLQSFTKGHPTDFKQIPLLIEASSDFASTQCAAIANALSEKVLTNINLLQRRKLHLAAVFANNFTNHLFYKAKEVIDTASLDFELLLPLIKETVKKLDALSPKEAQTGPARRADQTSINLHKDLLSKDPELLQLYETLTQSIIKLYQNKSES